MAVDQNLSLLADGQYDTVIIIEGVLWEITHPPIVFLCLDSQLLIAERRDFLNLCTNGSDHAVAVTEKSRSSARRIAMVAYTHYQTDPRCRREAELATAAGWKVHFYALSLDGRRHCTHTDGFILHELPLARYRGSSSVSYLMSYFRFLILASAAIAVDHWSCRFAVVHINTMPDFIVATGLLPRLTGARVILDIHDVMPEIYMTKFGVSERNWKIRLIKWIEMLSTRCAHAVLTSEHTKGELLISRGVPAGKITVLLNLPDDILFPLQFTLAAPHLPTSGGGDPASEFRLIYHGTLAHRLGLDRAVDALALISEELPGVRLQIFGEGDQLAYLQARASKLKLRDRIWFSGEYWPLEDIIPVIKRAHLAVLPTRPSVSTDYMLPTKLLEYLALGVPTLVTPTLTVRHYLGETHPFYLHDSSPEALAERIRWIWQNYAEAKRLTAALQENWFSRYHWPKHRQIYLDLIDRLADIRPKHYAPDERSTFRDNV